MVFTSDTLIRIMDFTDSLHGIDFPFISRDNYPWKYIYPVPEKKEKGKKKFVPFSNTDELISHWKKKHPEQCVPEDSLPVIWVRRKECGTKCILNRIEDNLVNNCYDMKDLFTGFTFLDGSPIGREE